MRQLEPVIWSKGTLLSPQHLQVQDRFLESQLEFRIDALVYQPWGFRSLSLDAEALAGGTVALAQASGIFSDGLLFDIPGADPAPDPKPLKDAFQPDQKTLDVFLAIPHYRPRGVNVALTGGQTDARYRTEYNVIRDENTGRSEKPVQIGRKNLRLLTGNESRQGAATLPLGRILRTEAGTYQLTPDVVPPVLDITASSFLRNLVRRLLEILSAKSSTLAGTRRQRNLKLADFTTTDTANFWLLYTINTHYPSLHHLLETSHSHPERVYGELLALAGALTTFAADMQPQNLPLYQHDQLGLCFSELAEKIRLLLETVVPTNYISLPLKRTEDQSIYATSLDQDQYLRNTRLFLAIGAEMNEGDLIGRVPGLVKVCSASHIEHLMRQALPGVSLTHAPRPPRAIPVKLDRQYFSLSQSGPAWEAITRARNFAAYIPGDLPAPSAELIILLPDAGS